MDEISNKLEKINFLIWLGETMKSDPTGFFVLKDSFDRVNTMLYQKHIISKPLIIITQRKQIEKIIKETKRTYGNIILRRTAVRLLNKYLAYRKEHPELEQKEDKTRETKSTLLPDKRWLLILREDFPDGYILEDFLSQFQAEGFWAERYGEASPLSGTAIDDVMIALGNVRDGRVYVKSDGENALFEKIGELISKILNEYTMVYRNKIYERFETELTKLSIYTEPVMTQQLLNYAEGRFHKTGDVFARPGKSTSLKEDCRKVLRNNGGAMSIDDITKVIWFIPQDSINRSLWTDEEMINLDFGYWMMAECFPLTEEEASKVGDVLDDCFVYQNFVKKTEVLPLLKQYLPSIADNLSGYHDNAIFKALNYYLKARFSFSKSLIAPKGAKQDFRELFLKFAKEHDQFTLEELTVFASDLNVPIYWENIYNGGAVRVSNNEFVNRKKLAFDIDNTDNVLENFCTGDYLPFQEVSTSMMMHLPTCGYPWSGYLLLSYVRGFSKTLRACYNSLSKNGYYGAMVKKSCEGIKSYEDLVERILTDDDTWVTTDDALALLVNKGIQAQKRFKGIEQVVVKARQNKL